MAILTHVYILGQLESQGYGRLLSFTHSLTSNPLSVIDVPISVYPKGPQVFARTCSKVQRDGNLQYFVLTSPYANPGGLTFLYIVYCSPRKKLFLTVARCGKTTEGHSNSNQPVFVVVASTEHCFYQDSKMPALRELYVLGK